jgi:hypothetical protein
VFPENIADKHIRKKYPINKAVSAKMYMKLGLTDHPFGLAKEWISKLKGLKKKGTASQCSGNTR